MDGEIWTVVVAGGEGRRFGARKQFVHLAGVRVIDRAIAAARSVSHGIVAVLPQSALEDPSLVSRADIVVAGGEDRSSSVRAGLAVVPMTAKVIFVHDAARPLASPLLFRTVLEALSGGADGAIPGLPITDTVKRVAGGRVVETLAREELVSVQTPQAFRASALREAHVSNESASDDACLLERQGRCVVVVAGEPGNIKLTDAHDLDAALRLLELAE